MRPSDYRLYSKQQCDRHKSQMWHYQGLAKEKSVSPKIEEGEG